MQQLIKRLISLIILMTFAFYMSAQTFTVPLRNIPETKGLYCDAKICGLIIDKCLMDTGSSRVVLTYKDFLHFKEKGIIGPHNYIGEHFIKGPDNKKSLYKRYKLKSIQLGNVNVPDVTVSFATLPNGIRMRLIGLELLERFNSVSINMKEKKMYLTI